MKNRGGFTIVETLITLAVASSLFVIIMTMFSGRQGRVEFAQGMRDIESYIQDVANDVRNGYYPSVNNQLCSVDAVTNAVRFDAGASTQGKNNSCIFAGKVLYFDNTSSPSNITSYSVAGVKKATTMAALKPRIIGIDGTETAETYKLPAGITLVNSSKVKKSILLGLMFNVEGVGATSKGTTSILPYTFSLASADFTQVKNSVANAFGATSTQTEIGTSGILLCFNSGTSNQQGTINIKKTIDGLSTTVLIGQDISGVSCINGV